MVSRQMIGKALPVVVLHVLCLGCVGGHGTCFDQTGSRPVAGCTVAFLGGSITEGNGFRPRLMARLRTMNPDVEFVEIAAGVSSTCSDAGAFRLERDVLRKGLPDVLIVDAAVNDEQDGHFDLRHSVRGLEGIVRRMLTANPRCKIVLAQMVNRSQYKQLSDGKEPVQYAAGRIVARHYGAAVADIGTALVASARAGGLSWDGYRDCHPSPAGCDFSAEVVLNAVKASVDFRKKGEPCRLPAPIDPLSYFNSRELDLRSVECGPSWRVQRPDWDSIPGSKRPYFTKGEALCCSCTNEIATIRFSGTALAALLTAGPDAGDLEVSVDGGPFRRERLRADYGELHYPYVQMLADDLPFGDHAVRLRVVGAHEPRCGLAVRINRLYENGAKASPGRNMWCATPEEISQTPEWMISPDQLAVDTNESVVVDAPRDMKLFLLIGQSNMSGRGNVSAEDAKPIARCLKLNRNGKWVAATSPIHFDRPSCGYGPANSFVRAYLAEHPTDTVGLVPCAVGGSLSVTWSPEDAPDPVGTNFRRALVRAREAQKNGRVVGILWHQGESDIGSFAKDPSLKERYSARLAEMVRVFRAELNCPDAPFLVGEIGTLPKNCTAMNPILAEAARRIPNAAVVKASDLTGHMPDGIHFDTPSYTTLGIRYYENWKRLTGCERVGGTSEGAEAIRAARGARRLTDIAALPVTDPGARLCYEGSIDRGQGNEDWNWGVYRDARGDWVLMEADGAGCIFNFVQHRYVTDCEAPVFRFYFEGEREPRLEVIPAEFGVRSPLLAPLAGAQKWRGKWRHGPTDKMQDFSIVRSFVPMEFTNGVRITSSVRLHGGEPGGWGHVQYHLYPSAEGLATFDPAADFTALAHACERPLDAGADAAVDTPAGELAAGKSVCLFERTGRGAVTAVSLALPAFEQAQLTNLWFSLVFDGKERVRAPVGTFFGNEQSCIKADAKRADYDFETSLLTFDLSREGVARLENRFPMPFWENARIVLENRGAVSVGMGSACVRTNSRLVYDRKTTGYFTATDYLPSTRNRRFRNATIGQGVGCGQIVYSVITGSGFAEKACEGDVRLYLDNMAAPAAQSDGSESWGCWGMGFGHAPKRHPFSFYNSPDKLGPWSLCRLNVIDSCNFRHVFRFEIEHGPDNLEEGSSHSGQVFYYVKDICQR